MSIAAQTRALAHYTDLAAEAQATLDRPHSALHYPQWLAGLPSNRLLPEAQALARELAALKGLGHTPQRGCSFTTKPLGESECLVEYEWQAGDPGRYSGPPEDCYPEEPACVTILQVFINGAWCDPSDFLANSILERWQQEIEQDRGDEEDAARCERDERDRDERNFHARNA